MIVNDLQRLRWQILDGCLRDTETEYFMGSPKDRETDKIKSILAEVNRKLKTFKRDYKCSKRQLQLDIALFERKGGKLEPRFRRGHKRILRFTNITWKNPLLRQAVSLLPIADRPSLSLAFLADSEGTDTLVLRLKGKALTEIGHEIYAIKTSIDEELKQMLWNYKSDIEVLSPEGLRQEMANEARTLLAMYDAPANEELISEAFASLNPEEENEEEQIPEEDKTPKKGEQLSLFDDLF